MDWKCLEWVCCIISISANHFQLSLNTVQVSIGPIGEFLDVAAYSYIDYFLLWIT